MNTNTPTRANNDEEDISSTISSDPTALATKETIDHFISATSKASIFRFSGAADKEKQKQQQQAKSSLTGNVDIIGILNGRSGSDGHSHGHGRETASMISMAPSDIFRKISSSSSNGVGVGNTTANTKTPKPVFPASEIEVEHHADLNDDQNSIGVEDIETTFNNDNDNYVPSTPPRPTVSTFDHSNSTNINPLTLSPLTPNRSDKRSKNPDLPHRRISSSERLMKMLDGMAKNKLFDVESDDDDDDDDEEDYQIQNHIISRGGGGTKKTSYTENASFYSTQRANNRSKGDSSTNGNGSSSSSYAKNYSSVQASTLSSPSSQSRKTGSTRSIRNIKKKDPTIHAQSFVLAIAFFFVWSPQNLMAPNLTQMAEYFHFSPEQRDLFLGANIALATGVLSLPVSAMLGFLADIVKSRILLFAGTCCCGGIASICTGLSVTYTQLYFARFLSGGCMAGSVVIAFSILGDFFDAKDRNAASSGLTSMMAAGILLGQVVAGTVGDMYGWKVPFYISGALTIFSSMMVLRYVREPVKGGKEEVLQEMIANGLEYDRILTWKGFLHAMTKNATNVILMLQGLFSSIPWGIVFTFLNDYLSQEQGLSVPASTFLVLLFGIGAAIGSITGGLVGGMCMRVNRSLLPLFCSAATLIGTFPFLGLLDLKLDGIHIVYTVLLALSSGLIANMPSVNIRPCILNVNPPETRGAAMTANNLMINVARGAGPSLITLSQKFFGVSRQYSFNITVSKDRSNILCIVVVLLPLSHHPNVALCGKTLIWINS